MKLVTIVCEAFAKEALKRVLQEVGAQGYTAFEVEGHGSHGERPADIRAFGNIQFEVIVQPETAVELLDRLERELFTRYAMIAYESDVRVLRPAKF